METSITNKRCIYCAEEIHIDAIKCKHCGELLNFQASNLKSIPTHQFVNQLNHQRKWSPGVAALLSFVTPGAGQMYKGNVGSGLLWMVFVVIGYIMLIIPGLILHLICIFAAASGDPYK